MTDLYQMDDPGGPDDGSPWPEWIYNPNDRGRWRQLNLPGGWFVYNMGRHVYGKDGRGTQSLYIGFTGNLEQRLRHHQRSKWWWPAVDEILVDLSESQADARDFERRYITRVQPVFNIMGVVGHVVQR
jgi:hypothetical protein